VAELKDEADEALETVRDLARGIYPPVLVDRGLRAALESQAQKAPVPVEVEAPGMQRFEADLEAAVYFCCLEAMQNAVKYAGATRIKVELAAAADRLMFTISDDGRGFDPQVVALGSGLQNMRDRMDALGGALEINSSPGAGTTVRGWAPANVPAATV
jgi:signal transduction histidine kinase